MTQFSVSYQNLLAEADVLIYQKSTGRQIQIQIKKSIWVRMGRNPLKEKGYYYHLPNISDQLLLRTSPSASYDGLTGS